jgi:hypothetical protein
MDDNNQQRGHQRYHHRPDGNRPFRGRGGNYSNRGQQQHSGFANNDNIRFQRPPPGGGRGFKRHANNDPLNTNQRNENYGKKPFSDEVANYGISYQKIEEICKDMDSKKILPGSSD